MSVTKRVLVIGANRGVGFELATRFLAKGYMVYGTYRSETVDDVSVQKLKEAGVKTFELDYAQEKSINAAAKDLGDVPLDILINNAALCCLWDDKPFTEQSAEDLLTHFKVNTVGPFVACKAFLPALQRVEKSKIITMSSNMASIADNDNGGNLCYRLSKTAVNQLTKTMAVDLANIGSKTMTLAVHPGYVATKMNDYYGEDDMEECMSALVETIEIFGTAQGADIPNGGYVNWGGKSMSL
ncbi:hypothetical protein BDV96DRAFT_577765 [Lophiotrema nucula]|uniref:Short chain dehydrogenase n=1 Tax=Lophiotrema nucula TaxID=690887 RepID=A0A6A5Z470_9PLEO|nr:hypothetical protein BDV96DRAFT_577765 [Lophiotrema nucula]